MAKLNEDEKLMLEHARQYFCVHADQRMRLVEFSLVAYGGLAAAYGTTLAQYPGVSVAAATLSFFFSALFISLDKRTSLLVKIAETPIARLEEKMAGGRRGFKEIRLIYQADQPTKKPGLFGASPTRQGLLGSYSKAIRGLHVSVQLASLLGVFYSVYVFSLAQASTGGH